MAYADLEANLKPYLKITKPDDDDLLEEKLNVATDIIKIVADREFEAASDTTRYVDYNEENVVGRTLYLDFDLCQITSVVNGNGVTVDPSEYVTIPRHETPYYALKLKTSAGKAWEFDQDEEDAIAITGRCAYSVTPPPLIVHACVRLAAWLYRQKDDHKGEGDRPIVTGAFGTVILPSRLPADIQDLLLHFKRLV